MRPAVHTLRGWAISLLQEAGREAWLDADRAHPKPASAPSNVREVDENGRPTLGLCFLPMNDLPIGDVML